MEGEKQGLGTRFPELGVSLPAGGSELGIGLGADTVPLQVSTGLTAKAQAPRRRVVLFVFQRDGVTNVPLEPGVGVVLGRDPAADVVIHDNSVSRRHARICLSSGALSVEDLGSTNGTRVDGRLLENSSSSLSLGQEVAVGSAVAFAHEMGTSRTSNVAAALESGVEAYDAFRDALAAELARARFFCRPFAVLAVRPLQKDAGALLRRVCARLREELRPIDHLALQGAGSIDILLPEISEEKALATAQEIVRQRAGEPRLVCGLVIHSGAADSVDKLLEASRRAAREASADDPIKRWTDQSTRAWMASERSEVEEDGPPSPAWLVAKSDGMRAVINTATRLGRSVIPVLVLGETGTGKEVVARLVHESGARRDKPLVCVNCAAIPGQLLESMLFGHEKGAFTGAVNQQKGVFEAAEGGTVLLDEIGELPAAAQAALLRVLETRRITRVGSTKEIEMNVRVLAATHRDLEAMVEAGTFRADLLYRLNTMTVRIPPLRARRRDIGPLATRFLHQANAANDMQIRGFHPDALALLEAYAWPGNVRELRNAVERAVVIAEDDLVRDVDLPERVRAAGAISPRADELPSEERMRAAPEKREHTGPLPEEIAPEAPTSSRPSGAAIGSLRQRMEQFEAELLLEGLRAAEWNLREAARLLDLPLRTLQHKLKAHGIRRLAVQGSGG